MSLRLAAPLISGALIGKLLGFARELEMARLLGATVVADSLRGAMTAVLLPVAPLQSDMVPSVLIPLHRQWAGEGDAAPRATALAALLTGIALVIAAGVFAVAAPWVGLLVAGFDAEAKALTVAFVRVMALSIPASVLSAVLSSVEIATGTSRIAAVRASVQNLGMIGGIVVMAWTRQPLAVPWSFVLAFTVVAIYGVATLQRRGALSRKGFSPRLQAEAGRVFFRRFRPLLAIPLADQGNILLERLLASGVAIGALASLDYARTLTESTFYLVSQPIGYVVLARTLGEARHVPGEVETISRRLLALGLPASVFLAVFAGDVVRVVFARGAFDAHAVELTTGVLRGISMGLWAAMLGWVLVRMVNAAGRNGLAAVVIVGAYGANALVNLVAVHWLGMLGLGLGEAARGVALLGGTAAALGCFGLVARCAVRGGLVALALACVGAAICAAVDPPLARLAVGAPVFGAVTLVWLGATMPERSRQVLALLRPRRLAPRQP